MPLRQNALVKPLFVALFVLVVAFAALRLSRAIAAQRRETGVWPFAAREPLSRIEQILYHRLVETLPGQIVLAQVPLSAFLRVRKGRSWREWHDRIDRQRVDFVVCERDFAVVTAIDVDDGGHDPAVRARDDAVKNRALAAAQVPLVRWRAAALPDAAAIRSLIDRIRRDRFGDIGAVTPPIDGPIHATRIDASNDPTMFVEETQT